MQINDIIGNILIEDDISDVMKKNIENFNISLLLFKDTEDIKSIANKLYIWYVLDNMGFCVNFTLDEITLTFDVKSFTRALNFFNLNDIK
jgi:hypothetical protein